MCEHEITTKIENGIVITYCAKCGKILDIKNAPEKECKIMWSETGASANNNGFILHD